MSPGNNLKLFSAGHALADIFTGQSIMFCIKPVKFYSPVKCKTVPEKIQYNFTGQSIMFCIKPVKFYIPVKCNTVPEEIQYNLSTMVYAATFFYYSETGT